MKPTQLFATLLLAVCPLLACHAQEAPYWDNPSRYRLNKVQPHDRVIPYGRWTTSLDGEWRMGALASVKATVAGRTMGVRVPSAASMVHADASAYLFSRSFTLPPAWQGRQTLVKVGAAGPAIFLYINGRQVGYSQDANTPAEWNISRYLQAGVNTIAIKVLAQCDGSRLETDPDRVGITRSIELISLPQTHITDIKIQSDLDTATFTTGLLSVMVDLNREVQGGAVEFSVAGQTVRKALEPRDWFLYQDIELPQVAPWTDTTPHLHDLTIRLFDPTGHELERIDKKVGFRHIDIRQGRLCLNGVPMRVRGWLGADSAVGNSRAEAVAVICRLKAVGVNAVRTCHGPYAEWWYDLCDSLGLLVFDEANLHLTDPTVVNDEEWLNPIFDRIYNLYKRDRNHPCVVAWSLGEGSDNGSCLTSAYRFIKSKDATRPVVYCGAARDWNTDLVFPLRHTPQHMAFYASWTGDPRPYVMAAFQADTLFPDAPLVEYMDTLCHHPQLQGGFARWEDIGQSYLLPCSDTLQSEPAILHLAAEEPAEPDPDMPPVPVVATICSLNPDTGFAAGFPWALTDGLLADACELDAGWIGFLGADTVELVFMLAQDVRLGQLSVGFAHHPDRDVLVPRHVQVQWSPDGRRWGRWRQLAAEEQPSDAYNGCQRLDYSLSPRRARHVRFLRLRVATRSLLPVWHRRAGQAAWLLLDEVKIEKR